MKSLVVCLISLLASASTALAEAPTVSGHVRLVDGSAVAGAQVLLFDVADLRRGALGQATTDAHGQFALSLGSLGGSGLPTRFALGQNYPNPFNPSTVIPYQLLTAAQVRLDVFNVLGQRVATLVDGEQVAGAHTVVWTATDEAGQAVSAGVYIAVLNDLRGFVVFSILLLRFPMLRLFQEFFYGFGFVVIGVYR